MNEKISVSRQTFNQILNYIVDKNKSTSLPDNLPSILLPKIQQTQTDYQKFLDSENISAALSAPSTPEIQAYEREIVSHQAKINQNNPLITQKQQEIKKLQKQEDDLKAEIASIPDTFEYHNEKQELRTKKDTIRNSKNELSQEIIRLEGENQKSNNKIQRLHSQINELKVLFLPPTQSPQEKVKNKLLEYLTISN
ncbi:hypothetical protein [Candidatus Phytoplasma pruni]|uniref:Uncharacterized protein n=1 Tax=Candidatus Phytoplasma pruni TaxID=479893 RepID=A0A851HCM5_9MOLU|nr:hypothetical protein [Candidatus Phytoplasma pruni]NWN45738.1 hypothetical protein [Candidatus Phytoplasma pruni]